MASSAPTVSGRWFAILIGVTILVAVAVLCYILFRNYQLAPRQP